MKYYKSFYHTNVSDDEEEVVKLTSTETEKIKVNAVEIAKETNEGLLKWLIEREEVGTHNTGVATIQNTLNFEVDETLDVGETFKITLKNKVAGTNAFVAGVIEYEIV
jgi:hypothetical protein